MRVIGLRHGQSEYNLLELCNDDPRRRVDLTELGCRQAEQAAQMLSQEPISDIYCSPLLRAVRTAEIVSAALRLPYRTESRLSDIRSGCDGKPVADYLAAIAADPLDARVNGGESLRDYQVRVNAFLRQLEVPPGRVALLVAHEETLRVFQSFFDGLALRDVAGRRYANCQPYGFQSASGN